MTDEAATSLLRTIDLAADAARNFVHQAIDHLRAQIVVDGEVDRNRLIRNQYAAHGCAWIAAYGQAIGAAASDLPASASAGLTLPARVTALGISEYVQQMARGIAMSQGEFIHPEELGLTRASRMLADNSAVSRLRKLTSDPDYIGELVMELAEQGADAALMDIGEDTALKLIREQCGRFVERDVIPQAHAWHLEDALIPDAVIEHMAELGLFALTIPEAHGGLGLGAKAAAVVAEELCRGYIGVGSIGTRADIAAELITRGGTDEQRATYLPRIARGEIIPTAAFTEPAAGSDLAAITTRARRKGDRYLVTGTKIWITHGARADLMTLLVRTDPNTDGYRGLTMLLADKPRGNEAMPFPATGMSGSEIPVLGYRGMKEYEIRFDDFAVPAANVLGGAEGTGFKQLMSTFETARIQTAGRALGVARSAFEHALAYACERRQFGRAIIDYPRIARKLAAMACEIAVVRSLISWAANRRDHGVRTDIEAGMAKLLAARLAWSSADNALQIHGGTGYATEHAAARLLCDARILSIFEGTAEIQADIIARGLATRP